MVAVGTGVMAGVAGIAVGADPAVDAGVSGAGVLSSPQAAITNAIDATASRTMTCPLVSNRTVHATISSHLQRTFANS